MWNPESFANALLRTLVSKDPAAAALQVRARGKTAILGIVDADVWVPLLRLSNPSASCNVMNLDVRHHQNWAPTFERGIADALAEKLLGPLRFTWAVEAEAAGWSSTSGRRH
jgi:hypothetical protein